MNNNKWTANQIAIVGARASKFPTHEVVHWQTLRAVPPRIRELLHVANETMAQIEVDPNLSAEGKKRKRADAARETIAQLCNPMEPAESAAGRRIEKLRDKLDALVAEGRPKDAAEAQIAAEIRAHVARSERPAMTALKLKGNKQAVAAILEAPCFLSGLNEIEASAFRSQVLDATDQQKEMHEIENALTVCRAAIKTATTMLATRGQLRQNSLNGAWEII
jgi:hypothetical protein